MTNNPCPCDSVSNYDGEHRCKKCYAIFVRVRDIEIEDAGEQLSIEECEKGESDESAR